MKFNNGCWYYTVLSTGGMVAKARAVWCPAGSIRRRHGKARKIVR